ncbi:MAG TPA: response regulator [Candidatus Angelobacter sp.]|nr:response regulator [Candidatus Angelobacter sp.]
MKLRSSKSRILLVDDRGENRYVLSRILQNAGFTVEECATGTQALEVVRTLPDAVILDVKLPDISGYEVCRGIKTDPLTKVVPVLLMSAVFVPDQTPPEMAKVGAEGYLSHPFVPSDIVEKIRNLLPK